MGNTNEIEAEEALVIDVTNCDSTVLADTAIPEEEESFLQFRTAAILFGSAAGIFGGAFDVQGNNVLAVVCLNSAFVVAIDFFKGDLGDFYYSYFCLTSLPGVLLGVVAGQYASKWIDPVLFKNLVLVMCLGLIFQPRSAMVVEEGTNFESKIK